MTLVAGCAEIPLVINAGEAFKYAAFGSPDTPIDRALVTKLPYASIMAKIGNGPKSLLVLSRYDGQDLHWISADRAILVTRHGRVVKTAGFPENIKATMARGTDPVDRRLHEMSEKKFYYTREVDLDLGKHYGIQIRSEFKNLGKREIEIVGLDVKTILVREDNFARSVNWNFTNYYWVDEFDGFVWKSLQHISRTFPPVAIEVLKPAELI